ncbi:NUDIX hydrolase [Streptodolium elevatio]
MRSIEGGSAVRHSTVIGVHLVLRSNRGVLLGLRHNTAFGDGQYHLCAGHLEAGESVLSCAVREAREETGVELHPDDLSLVHTLHHFDPDDGRTRLQVFLEASRWTGEITLREPECCAGWRWFPDDALPTNTVAYTADALTAIKYGIAYAESGWPT